MMKDTRFENIPLILEKNKRKLAYDQGRKMLLAIAT